MQVTKKSHRFLCGCSGQEKLVRQSDVRALSEKQQEQTVPAELKLKRRKRPGTRSLNGLVCVLSVFWCDRSEGEIVFKEQESNTK